MRAVLCFDGGAELGLGHVHRCLTLGEALAGKSINMAFLTRTPEALPTLNQSFRVIKASAGSNLSDLAKLSGRPDLFVLDHLAPLRAHVADLKQALLPGRLALLGNREAEDLADLTVRQSAGDEAVPATVLSGPSHLILKPQFAAIARRQITGPARRALVCLGGGRPRGLARLLALLEDHAPESLNEVIVIGVGANAVLPASVKRSYKALDQTDAMAATMSSADIGLISSGGVAFEAAACGLPALYLPVVEPQIGVAQVCERAGFGRLLANPDTVSASDFAKHLHALLNDAPVRQGMAQAGQSAIDGQGADRVARALIALAARS